MDVELTREAGSKARLTVTLSPDEVKRAIDSTHKRLAARVRVPGFRPGKAPRHLLERMVGEEAFLHEATEEAMERGFRQALQQTGIVPLEEADVNVDGQHLEEGQPFTFEATVTVRPEVHLPNYHDIRIPAPQVTVTDTDVTGVIDQLRTSRATLEPAPAKPAEIGDVVTMNVHGRVEGREVMANDNADFELVSEAEKPHPSLPGLSPELVGAHVGDIREIVLTLPPDYADQDLAGKVLTLNVIVKDVKRKVLPPLDDDFAKEVSERATVAELRELIRENLETERTREAHETLINEVLDSMIARTNIQVPDIMLRQEQDRLLREQRRWFEARGLKFEQFLVAARTTEDDFRHELRPAAERRVKRELILAAVAEAEGIEPPKEDVDAQMRLTAESAAASRRDFQRYMRSESLRNTIVEDLSERLALARLVEIVSGVKILDAGGDAEATEPEAPEPVAMMTEPGTSSVEPGDVAAAGATAPHDADADVADAEASPAAEAGSPTS